MDCQLDREQRLNSILTLTRCARPQTGAGALGIISKIQFSEVIATLGVIGVNEVIDDTLER